MTAAICGIPAYEEDYYKTTVAGGVPRTVNLSWSGTDVLELALFDSTGTQLGFSQAVSPQTIPLSGPDGTYYLRVVNATVPASVAATPYTIQVTQAGDLFSHNGFEACWSKASTLEDFLTSLTNSVEGVPGCIPSAPNASPAICTTISGTQPTCPGDIAGCPITLRAKGPSTNVQFPLVADGISKFDSTATVDSFSMPIIALGAECMATITSVDPVSMASISIRYEIAFDVTADGNNGSYVADVDGVSGVDVSNLTKNQVTLSGDSPVCQLFSSYPITYVDAALASAIPAAVSAAQVPATIGNAICPLQ